MTGERMDLDWWDMSCRLRRFIMTRSSDLVYGYKWSQQCGHWVVMIIKNKDVYIDPEKK